MVFVALYKITYLDFKGCDAPGLDLEDVIGSRFKSHSFSKDGNLAESFM